MENKPNLKSVGARITDILLMLNKALHLKTLREKNPNNSFFPPALDIQETNSRASRTFPLTLL